MTRRVTRYQALFRHFPDRPWNADYTTQRTVRITGRTLGEDYDSIRKGLSRLIGPDYLRKVDREGRARRSRGMRADRLARAGQLPELNRPTGPSAADDAAAEAFLSGLGTSVLTSTLSGAEGGASFRGVSPDSIELRLVDEDSEILSEVYPPLFLCDECHGYYYLDPNGTDSLACPNHGGRTELRQVNIVYSCARCANIEPLLPYNTFLRKLSPGPIRCNAGHPIRLDLAESLSNARWRCSERDCPSEIDDERINRLCSLCNISEESLLNQESKSVMAPRSAAAGEIAVPLTTAYVRDENGQDVRLENLRTHHKEVPGSFTLSTVEPSAALRLRHLGVVEAFDVPRIQSILAIYAYRSAIRPRPEVAQRERYPRFFQLQPGVERFRAYVTVTEGRGLVLGLSKDRLASRACCSGDGESDYITLQDRERDRAAQVGLQDLLEADSAQALWPITKTLHAIEHALRASLCAEIGLEDFDSRIMLQDASILLFETRDLGDGGIRQLNQQSGLMTSWFARAIRMLRECPQLCENSCIACVRTDNASCHGFLAQEFPRWMPPNILMDRILAKAWLDANA